MNRVPPFSDKGLPLWTTGAYDITVEGSAAGISPAAHIGNQAHIGHDVVIRKGATVCPRTTIGGWVTVLEGAFIGINATIKNRVTIGKHSYVCAGAVVLRDVPPGSMVLGNPARVTRTPQDQNRICHEEHEPACNARYCRMSRKATA